MLKISSLLLFVFSFFTAYSQSIDDPFAHHKMRKDLEVFKQIRLQVNSGLYKYRTIAQIDSIYSWAEKEISNLSTYREFYNLINTLTDYEGSCHNNTRLPVKLNESLKEEGNGYFPYPIKWIDGKWIVNYENGMIPLGAEILSINDEPMGTVIMNLNKYYPTDGVNKTGKRIGIWNSFGRYYRFHYGLKNAFEVVYRLPNSNEIETVSVEPTDRVGIYRNFLNRYSRSFDRLQYKDPEEHEIYTYSRVNNSTGLLTINTFSFGEGELSEEHKVYKQWLDSVFVSLKTNGVENLIVDVRNNGGGTDPNDVLTYSYLTDRNFQESKQVWISFNKIPLLKHYDSPIPAFLRFLGVGKFNRLFQNRFPNEQDGKYYIGKHTSEMRIWKPNENAFTGTVYLLVSPAVASAGSLFAAMVAGNENSVVVGEETQGGYYGHNGHTDMDYVLPKSKIEIGFFVENIEQDVPETSNQFYNRGIIPDHTVHQSYPDFISNTDTQLDYVMKLITEN